MLGNFSHSAKLHQPSGRIHGHVFALLVAILGVVIAVSAIHAPVGTVVVFGGLLSIVLARLMRRRAWLLLCGIVIPAIGAGELWTVEVGDGTLIAPSLIVVAACATGLFLAVLTSKRESFWRLPLVGCFVALWVAILLSVINTVSVLHWARGLLEAILGLAFLAYPHLYLRNRRQLSLCLSVLVGLAAATVIFGLLQYSTFDTIRSFFPLMYSRFEIPFIEEWQTQGRMVANWVHPSNFGSLLNLAAPIALYSALRTRKDRWVPLLTFLLIASGIFLTATRTPIVAFCFANTLLYILIRRRINGLWIVAGALFLLVMVAPLFSVSLERFKFSEQENLLTVEMRGLMWLESASFFFQHPLVGIGARNFPDQTMLDPHVPTHNIYLQVAAETGAIGLIAFLYLLYRALRMQLNHGKGELPQDLKNLQYAFLCSSLSIVLESFTDNDFYVWQVWCLFWLIRGLSAVIAARPQAFIDNYATASV